MRYVLFFFFAALVATPVAHATKLTCPPKKFKAKGLANTKGKARRYIIFYFQPLPKKGDSKDHALLTICPRYTQKICKDKVCVSAFEIRVSKKRADKWSFYIPLRVYEMGFSSVVAVGRFD